MRSATDSRPLMASVLCISILALAVTSAPCAAAPQAKPAAGMAVAKLDAERQARAHAIMMKMAQFLAGTPRFRVSLRAGYDAVQQSGQKIEFIEDRTVTVNRPHRLRIEGIRSDGVKTLTVFTGKEVVLVDYASKVYAMAPQPGSLDETIVYFVRDLGMRLPLAALLLEKLPADLQERVRSVEYVELTSIAGATSHHIAARTDTVDVQMWVADGAQPLPQRVVLTYKKESGQPQFWAEFSKWSLAPEINEAMFALQGAEGLQKVAFAAQLPRLAPAAPKAALKKEGT